MSSIHNIWCPSLLILDKINRPSRLRRAIGFFKSLLLTSKASPNDIGIVIIIIIGEVKLIFHNGGIIAQSYTLWAVYLSSADSLGSAGL